MVVKTGKLEFAAQHGDHFVAKASRSADSIPAFRAVKISGYVDGVVTVELADSSSGATLPAVGLSMEKLTFLKKGKVAISGAVVGIRTTQFAPNTILYVSSNGELSATPPIELALRQPLCLVVHQADQGIVKITAHTTATAVTTLPSLAEGDILTADSAGEPIAVSVAPSSIVGRSASGGVGGQSIGNASLVATDGSGNFLALTLTPNSLPFRNSSGAMTRLEPGAANLLHTNSLGEITATPVTLGSIVITENTPSVPVFSAVVIGPNQLLAKTSTNVFSPITVLPSSFLARNAAGETESKAGTANSFPILDAASGWAFHQPGASAVVTSDAGGELASTGPMADGSVLTASAGVPVLLDAPSADAVGYIPWWNSGVLGWALVREKETVTFARATFAGAHFVPTTALAPIVEAGWTVDLLPASSGGFTTLTDTGRIILDNSGPTVQVELIANMELENADGSNQATFGIFQGAAKFGSAQPLFDIILPPNCKDSHTLHWIDQAVPGTETYFRIFAGLASAETKIKVNKASLIAKILGVSPTNPTGPFYSHGFVPP